MSHEDPEAEISLVFQGSAAPLPLGRNPFQFMVSPDIVLHAVEQSKKLVLLNRRMCRPLDRWSPSGSEQVDPSPLGRAGGAGSPRQGDPIPSPLERASMPEISYEELVLKAKNILIEKGIRGEVLPNLKAVLKGRNPSLWYGSDIENVSKPEPNISAAVLQDFIQFMEPFPNESEFVELRDQELPQKLGLSAAVVDQLVFVSPLVAQASIARIDPSVQQGIKLHFRHNAGRYGKLWRDPPNSNNRLPRRLVAMAMARGINPLQSGLGMNF